MTNYTQAGYIVFLGQVTHKLVTSCFYDASYTSWLHRVFMTSYTQAGYIVFLGRVIHKLVTLCFMTSYTKAGYVVFSRHDKLHTS